MGDFFREICSWARACPAGATDLWKTGFSEIYDAALGSAFQSILRIAGRIS